MADERIDHREPPASLIALRNELPLHPEIYKEAIQGRNFEECLAIVAYMLDIALDGMYDVDDLCDLLVTELKRVGTISLDGTSTPRDPRLVSATIVEMADRIVIEKGTVQIQEVDGVERIGIVDEDTGTSVLLAEDASQYGELNPATPETREVSLLPPLEKFNAEPFLQEFESPSIDLLAADGEYNTLVAVDPAGGDTEYITTGEVSVDAEGKVKRIENITYMHLKSDTKH